MHELALSGPAEPVVAADLDERRALLVGIAVGTPAREVERLLGEPDEVRREGDKLPWFVGAAEEWAYGVIGGKGGFAAVGLVLIDSQRNVFMAHSPHVSGSLRPGADRVAVSDEAIPSPTGMICRLERVALDGDGLRAELTLFNRGERRFEFAHDHTGIGGNLVAELFDRRGRLLCRSDRLMLHSPYEPDQSRWPVLAIEPGASAAEEVRLGWRWPSFGALPAGAYRIRVAFPFDDGAFYPSNTVDFTLPGAGVEPR
jgi:hypothetical protein